MARTYTQDGPIARALELVGERWTLLLLQELLKGVRRFSDLIVSVEGISPNVLSSRLKTLEECDVIEQRTYSVHPPRGEYFLTRKGHELGVVAGALAVWGARHTNSDIDLVHTECGNSIDVVYHCECCKIHVPRSEVKLDKVG